MAEIVQMANENGAIYPVSNVSGNGYCKMADGTLIQWGTINNYTSGNTVKFPVNFIGSPVIGVFPSYNTGTTARCVFSTSQVNMLGFGAYAWDTVTGTISEQTNLAFYYIAIGRWK